MDVKLTSMAGGIEIIKNWLRSFLRDIIKVFQDAVVCESPMVGEDSFEKSNGYRFYDLQGNENDCTYICFFFRIRQTPSHVVILRERIRCTLVRDTKYIGEGFEEHSERIRDSP